MILFATFSHGHIFHSVQFPKLAITFPLFSSTQIKPVRMQVNRLRIVSPRGWEPGQEYVN